MKSIFQKVYDAEQNFIISCYWDNGFMVRFGDGINGYDDPIYCNTWKDVESIMKQKLKEL